MTDTERWSAPRDATPSDERDHSVPAEQPAQAESPPLDDAPASPLTAPDDTEGG